MKELNDWMKVIEKDLDDMKWFEEHPASSEQIPRRKEQIKNISGIGIMTHINYMDEGRQMDFEAWRDGIMREVKKIESTRS